MTTIPTEVLIQVVCDPTSTQEQRGAAAGAFLQAASREPVARANEELRKLGAQLGFRDPSRAAFLALVCGAMVEHGADPGVIAEPLVARLRDLLQSAMTLVNQCAVDSDDDDADPMESFEVERRRLAASLPKENADWEALNTFWRPAIAVFSKSAPARAAARPLRETCVHIASFHTGGHWLQLILTVLDAEPILVIEPASRQ